MEEEIRGSRSINFSQFIINERISGSSGGYYNYKDIAHGGISGSCTVLGEVEAILERYTSVGGECRYAPISISPYLSIDYSGPLVFPKS
jgi:hypothetical protein